MSCGFTSDPCFCLLFIKLTSMSPMWIAMCVICVVEGGASHKKEAMTSFILHQSNPSCRDGNTNALIPCSLTGQEDYQRLMSANSANASPPGQLKISCKDGSNNMTCLPLSMAPVRYFCGCVSEKGDLNTAIGWHSNWEEINGADFAINRKLCDAQAGWCLDAMFKKNLVYLVKHYAPLDSQISVSSVLEEYSTVLGKEKIRLEYNGGYCAWIRDPDDPAPWVKFDFLQNRTAVGLVMGKRCDATTQSVTSFHVSTSDDDVTWSYIGNDVQAVYEGIIATWWFERDISARYWRIEPVTFTVNPSMQADFIGYI